MLDAEFLVLVGFSATDHGLLDPLVRGLQKVRLPRGLSVALVYLSFAVALGLIILAVTTAGLAGVLDVLSEPRPVGVHGLATLVEPIPFLAELSNRGVRAAVFEGVPVAS